ncbi:MAG: acyltransferase, partial [Pseudomonadota bacterium]
MSETGHARTIAYRRDIDGLRAVAVVAVTLFHLGFHSLEGGFLGVDVFFVISGFLITAIIEKRTGNGKLSFKDFYFGRIRRLLPAMLVTVAATLIGAAIIMTPDDLIAFAGSAIGAILSVSNFVFYFESGYWDTASELKPLLHTWSLGVEEQFYLFWPALLLLVFVNFAKRAGLIFALISAAGLALSEYMRATDPSAAFYLFPFRIFEFSLGALVIYIGRGGLWSSLSRFAVIRDGVGIVGLGIICASVWFYKGSTPFPGIYALPPVLGTMMVILAGCGDRGTGPVSRAVLSNPVSNWLGQVSYSMYLAHWPIIVLYRYETGLELELAEQAGLAVAILIATILLHYGVERRFRYKAPDPSTGTTSLNPTGFALATLAAGYSLTLVHGHILVDRGWAWRMPDIQLTPDMIAEGMDARFNRTNAGCRIDQIGVKPGCDLDRETNILVFGNSHEPDGFNFLTAGFEAQPEL